MPLELNSNRARTPIGKMICNQNRIQWITPKKGNDIVLSYIFPPRSFELSVTTIAPIQTNTNTCANSGPPSFVFGLSAEPCKIAARNVHKINGPHKSPENKCQNQSLHLINSQLIKIIIEVFIHLQSLSNVDFSFGYNTW